MSTAQFSNNLDKAVAAAKRFEAMTHAKARKGYRRMNLVLDLTAADGVNGNRPLDWDRLLAADVFNFMHDLCGIAACIDRSTGELTNHFLPRCTRKEAA